MENPNMKWMITGGTPISGNLQICALLDQIKNLRVFGYVKLLDPTFI
jgi:hypothetical protein